MKILLTGSAGFIGFHVAKHLLERGDVVVGVDNFNDYYDPKLKEQRNSILEAFENYSVVRMDIADANPLESLIRKEAPDKICHVAAQAGVRYSLENPLAYIRSNERGFVSVLEAAHKNGVKDVVFASSSSVYGESSEVPFVESARADKQVSLYAATKRANELIAYAYYHNYGLRLTGLRFFTVYGPWNRPDMAIFKFAHRILSGESIDVYNGGNMRRDWTFVDDIAKGVLLAIDKPQEYEIINLGRGQPIELNEFISHLESVLGKKAVRNDMPMQPGDVVQTYADVSKAKRILGYAPAVSVAQGIAEFAKWFVEYRKG